MTAELHRGPDSTKYSPCLRTSCNCFVVLKLQAHVVGVIIPRGQTMLNGVYTLMWCVGSCVCTLTSSTAVCKMLSSVHSAKHDVCVCVSCMYGLCMTRLPCGWLLLTHSSGFSLPIMTSSFIVKVYCISWTKTCHKNSSEILSTCRINWLLCTASFTISIPPLMELIYCIIWIHYTVLGNSFTPALC